MGEQWKEKILSNMPKGWVDAFGDLLCEELSKVVSDDFTVVEVKEKYGSLRIYCGGTTSPEVWRIIATYEFLSGYICCVCGKPDVPMVSTNWCSPYCGDCYYKHKIDDKPYLEVITPKYWMPDEMTIHKYFNGEWIEEKTNISETVAKIRERWIKRWFERGAEKEEW